MFKINKKSLVSVVVVVSILLSLASIIPPSRTVVMPIIRFPLIIFNGLRQEVGGMIFYHRNLVQKERLQLKCDFLQKALSDKQELERENQRLHELLNFKRSAGYRVIAARVIGRDLSNWTSSVIIDKGSSSGIRKGYVSVTFRGLVGRVVEVTGSTSTIMLITDPTLSVSAVLQRSRQEGLVCGSLGGALIMKYLPQDSDIKISDAVVTSGLTPVYPKGLPIGTVIQIGEEFSSLSRYAVIRPAVDLSAVEEVLIIIP